MSLIYGNNPPPFDSPTAPNNKSGRPGERDN